MVLCREKKPTQERGEGTNTSTLARTHAHTHLLCTSISQTRGHLLVHKHTQTICRHACRQGSYWTHSNKPNTHTTYANELSRGSMACGRFPVLLPTSCFQTKPELASSGLRRSRMAADEKFPNADHCCFSLSGRLKFRSLPACNFVCRCVSICVNTVTG